MTCQEIPWDFLLMDLGFIIFCWSQRALFLFVRINLTSSYRRLEMEFPKDKISNLAQKVAEIKITMKFLPSGLVMTDGLDEQFAAKVFLVPSNFVGSPTVAAQLTPQ